MTNKTTEVRDALHPEYVRNIDKKEVGNFSYDQIDAIWKGCGADIAPENMRYQFARAIQEELAGRFRAQGGNTSDNSNSAAANKAAKEGELPSFKRYDINSKGLPFEDPDGPWVAYEDVAADRASRQVANKAEVEPVTVDRAAVRDAVADSMTGLYYCGRVWSAWGYGTMSESDFSPAADDEGILDNITDAVIDIIGKSSVLPATTGASTARDQALEEAASLVEGCDKRASLRGIAVAIRMLKGSAPASTVLTDEQLRETDGYKLGWMEGMSEGAELATGGEKTAADVEAEFSDLLPGSYYMDPPDGGSPSVLEQVSRMAEDAAKWREVAAQAGQVAVPEDVARDAARFRWLEERFTGFDFYWMGTPPYESEEDKGKCVIVFECGQEFEPGRHFQREIDKQIGLPAAPSPAKESK